MESPAEPNNGPGSYSPSKPFGADLGKITIGKKVDERIETSVGPGHYNPERSDSLTKPRTVSVNLDSSP